MLYLPDCPACLLSATNDDQFEASHGEVIEDGESTCEWVNEECPAQCRTEHDEPEPGSDYRDWRDQGCWTCPDTGDRFRYCTHCGWQTMGRWDNQPIEINGDWYCDPGEHGLRSCDDCGDYHNEDSMSWFSTRSEWDDDSLLCTDCYGEAQRERSQYSTGERKTTCSQCGTENTYMDEYTETFVCKCGADRLRAAKKPVMAAA